MAGSFVRLLKGRPGLWGSFCCFWLWPWLLSNTLRRSGEGSVDAGSLFGVHMWLSLFLVLALVLLGIAVLYRMGRFTLGVRGILGISCAALPLAGAAALFCALAEPESSAVWWVASATWLVPGGTGVAFMCLVWGRVFGNMGAASTLFVGVISTVVASLTMLVLLDAPEPVAKGALLMVAVACAGLLLFDFRRHPDDYEDSRGCAVPPTTARSATPALPASEALELPWKLVATVFVWALAFGAVSVTFDTTEFWSRYAVPTYVVAAVLLLVCALRLHIDFNHLIYKIGFVAMAAGTALMLLLPASKEVGYITFNMGYRFVELLVWALCAHLSYDRGISPTWIVPLNVGTWTLGRRMGFNVSFALVSKLGVSDSKVLVVALFSLMTAALFLTSRGNLVEGWGIDRIDASSLNSAILRRRIARTAKTYGLSNREEEVLGAMMRGMTRAQIAQAFVVSEETVKTHVKHIYRKLGVASRDELGRMVSDALDPVDSVDPVPMRDDM